MNWQYLFLINLLSAFYIFYFYIFIFLQMIYQELEKFIYSLSTSEKRQFHSYANQLKSDKFYLKLFDLILEARFDYKLSWEESFRQQYPEVSLESVANYLFKVLSDVLVQMRIDQNAWYQQMHGLMKAKLYFERSLDNRGVKELKTVYKKADKSENYINSYLAIRMELDSIHIKDQFRVDEQYLIDKQMEAKSKLQAVNETQEHYSLFELLSYRLSRKPNLAKESADLIFSELNLVFNKKTPRFETKKLHLMFQSFYFIHKSHYESALHVFEELSLLFETSPFLWNSPPYDYLSILDGILNSLRSTYQFDRMQEFIDKIRDLLKEEYTAHFLNVATVVSKVYQLNYYVMTGAIDVAKKLIDENGKAFPLSIVDQRLKIEYYYLVALTFFLQRDYVQAKRVLIVLFNNCYVQTSLIAYRAAKLLFIITIYETDDSSFLESEIRAYKRTFQKVLKMYKVEKLVFKILKSDPKRRGNEWKRTTLISSQLQLHEIIKGKSDVSMLKFFDYYGWISKLLKSN